MDIADENDIMMCIDFHELQVWAGVLIGVSGTVLGYFVYRLVRG